MRESMAIAACIEKYTGVCSDMILDSAGIQESSNGVMWDGIGRLDSP
jgi:predicted metal-dependent hydrolase